MCQGHVLPLTTPIYLVMQKFVILILQVTTLKQLVSGLHRSGRAGMRTLVCETPDPSCLCLRGSSQFKSQFTDAVSFSFYSP